MKKVITFLCCFIALTIQLKAQSGPAFIKEQLTASGVYNTPGYEFTNAYDSYNTSNANGTIKGMFLHGLPYSKSANTNNETKVFCWYGEPNGLQDGEKVPAVILVHGGGGEAYTAWVDEWINRGYIAIAMSLRGNTPDSDSTEYSGPPQEFFFSDNGEALQDQWFYHAIATAMMTHSLLRDSDFTTHVDTNHIGVTGISWGGINNTVLAGIDERLDFVIPVYGCAFLTDSPIYSTQFSRMSNTAQAFYLANWEPALYTPYHSAPMLFVDGNKDLQFTLNIFSKTYDASASPEKFLRIEDAMGHGHGAGRRPQEIYDFADYVTGFNSNAVKPLTFTSENTNDENLVTYEYDFEGDVDEAILYYCNDTLEWGKTDPDFIWLTKTASLTKGVNGGTVSVTIPDEAQVYYLNINNTNEDLMYTSQLRYNTVIIDYDWFNYGTGQFNTLITQTTGGTHTENVNSPDVSGINSSTQVGQFQIEAGTNSRIEFGLNKNITDLSYFEQKVNIYLDAAISSISNTKIRVYLLNSTVGYGTSVHRDFTLTQDENWTECTFDFSNESIPTEVSMAGGFDRAAIMFAPGDTETSGTVYYFDDVRGTIEQPPYVAPEVFYDWFDYSVNPAVEAIDFVSTVGGTFDEFYDISTDGDVMSSDSETGIASKFTKTAGDYQFAQIRYDFEDGAIKDDEHITFRLKALFKPESTTEINVLDDNTRAVQLYFRNNNGEAGTSTQIGSTKAYFTQTNAWEILEFTFNSTELIYFDRLMIMVTPQYTNPIDEDGLQLDEDLTYYFEALTANEDIQRIITSVENFISIEKDSFIYPNPINDIVHLRAEKNSKYQLYNSIGELLNEGFTDSNDFQINLENHPSGMYFIRFLKNGKTTVNQFLKN